MENHIKPTAEIRGVEEIESHERVEIFSKEGTVEQSVQSIIR